MTDRLLDALFLGLVGLFIFWTADAISGHDWWSAACMAGGAMFMLALLVDDHVGGPGVMRRAPLKRRRVNSGRASAARCCRTHAQWVRGHDCAVPGCERDARDPMTEKIEAAHVRTGTDGGMGLKPSDHWLIPLCAKHHKLQHQIGEESFEARTGVPMRECALELAARSPHLRKLRSLECA